MQTILVTGAATGVGLAVAKALTMAGYRIIAAIMPAQESSDLRALPSITIVEADLAHEQQIADLLAAVKAVLEPAGRLHAIVSNAGIAVPGPLEIVPLAQVRLQFQINTFAPLQIITALLPELRAARGRVIVIGAGQARASLPGGGAYGASKVALAAMIDSLRAEVAAYGVKMSVLEPGAISTGILKSSENKWAEILGSTSAQVDTNVMRHYRSLMTKSLDASARAFATAMSPDAFAEIVRKVLESRKPKPRYLIGREARALALVALLPGRMRAALMARIA